MTESLTNRKNGKVLLELAEEAGTADAKMNVILVTDEARNRV